MQPETISNQYRNNTMCFGVGMLLSGTHITNVLFTNAKSTTECATDMEL